MRILVMGTGGIGGYYGGRLAEAGADVFFVARGGHLEAIKKHGLRITSVRGNFHLAKVAASSEPKDAGPVDVILLGVKTWDIESAVAAAKPALKRDGMIVHFQNGVDIADRIGKVIEPRQVVGGVEYGVVQISNPGCIDHSTQIHQLIYGKFGDHAPPALEPFHRTCEKANFDCSLVEDIAVRIWSKFLFICAYSGVTSLLRLPIGPILADADTLSLYEKCMREISAVAHAKGVRLPIGIVEDRLEFSRKLEPNATSSMQRDLAAGRRMELDALNGTLCRFGRETGVPTPVNDVISAALKLHSLGRS